ncbi:hypothetical protein GPECTOR_30g151 [Gonium pectorale]|uniref:Uncharacterized protein n=1 Tax=Gonium pectorale TaxID=33097 RepID=A0A150GDZ6_GONPE|nr:hypothetical protein GPECTOR_30g151 [Gonium pectorale]|eukprot:KXZ48056.1 hypothetical protein GPECTOR_30g151 [Gonium pectorale]
MVLDLLHVDPAFRGSLVRGGRMLAAAVVAATFALAARGADVPGSPPPPPNTGARGGAQPAPPHCSSNDGGGGGGVPCLPFLPLLSDLTGLPAEVLLAAAEGVLGAVLQVEEAPPQSNPLRS